MPAPSQALARLDLWAKDQEIPLGEAQREAWRVYLDNLLLWNRRVALVSQDDASSIVDKHFADSLLAAQFCQHATKVVDLGSGAGFPGIIIAVQHSSTEVTLVESRRKKASFLEDTVRALRLENVQIVSDRIESLATRADHAAQYHVAIARALGTVTTLLTYSHDLLIQGGQAIAMKGPAYEADLEAAPVEHLGFEVLDIHPYRLPDGSSRTLIRFIHR